MTAMNQYEPTTDIAEAQRRCDPSLPLQGELLEHWYVDCDEARGVSGFVDRLARSVTRANGDGSVEAGRPFSYQIVSGHIGCGKSTDLRALQQRLEDDGYTVVFVNTDKEVSPEELDIEAIVLVTMRELAACLDKLKIELDPKVLNSVREWFGTVLVEKADQKEADLQIGAEASLGAATPLFKLFVPFRGYIKAATSSKSTFKAEYRRYLSDLVENLNNLFASANLGLEKAGSKGLVLVVDGPDKLRNSELQEEVFVDHGDLLGNIGAHLLMTAPIDLVCSERVEALRRWFGDPEILPSIQVDKSAFLAKAKEIITRRCSESLFADGVLDAICQASGGDTRHIIHLTRNALSRTAQAPVRMEQTGESISALRRTFADWLQDSADKPDYSRLVEVDRNPQAPVTDSNGRRLLVGSAVLCYSNGDRWYKVHPVVKQLSQFRKLSGEGQSDGA